MRHTEIRQIKTFISIAGLNSFTQAAKELGYAQSSITKQIQLLEKELGVLLFERLGKTISLTSAGNDFLVYSRQMLNLWEEAKGSIREADKPTGRLIIGAEESICGYKLPELLKEYNRRYPDVELILKIASGSTIEPLLRENNMDVAIISDTKRSSHDLVVEMAQDEPFALLTSPSHLLAHKNEITLEDLSVYPLLMPGQGCSWQELFRKELEESNVTFKFMAFEGSNHTLKQLAVNGLGIALLPLYTVTQELEEKKLVMIPYRDKHFKLITQVVYHKDKWKSSAINAFLALYKEWNF
ncbi:LysR family transcriptional regulator [Gorillibacterium timonense]|uniref:LysR family transcriptional regulator n=1 Tax=Gorillibacterium timonense TaxID=1689269 RepID=UPI00071C5B76|nr:LysR family transcriptional regulator [Gorillibacterium timonense]